MEQRAVDGARGEFDRMSEALAGIRAATEHEQFGRRWSDLLNAAGRIYSKLEQSSKGSPESKAWFGDKKHERRSDALLCYFWHARNADEHGLEAVTRHNPGSAKFVEPTATDFEQLNAAMAGEKRSWIPLGLLEWTPEHVNLVVVTDRGVRYEPPRSHLGQPVEQLTATGFAELLAAQMQSILHEAQTLANKGA